MHHLGHTRSSHQRDHFLLTADTFVRASFPGMRGATAIVHVSPAHGAGFTEYTVEFGPSSSMHSGGHQTFLFVLSGSVSAAGHILSPGQFLYLGLGAKEITSGPGGRAVIIEKPHIGPGPVHAPIVGDEKQIAPKPLMGDEALQVRTLLPESPAFDFAVNLMTFQPGATLPMVDVHVMEHGLLMLEGGGIYRLNDHWYPVTAGDFIWMAPYCPQWFGALGKVPAKYLIYKDWNRHPLQTR